MRILHVQQTLPYPATNGLNLDTLRRLKALQYLGNDVMVLTWVPSSAEHPDVNSQEFRKDFPNSLLIPLSNSFVSTLRRIMSLVKYPWYIGARELSKSQLWEIVKSVRDFRPEFILVEAVHASVLGLFLARRLNLPMVYRSHNIEHIYLRQQARLSSSWLKKLAIRLGALRLRHFELSAIRQSVFVLDISVDDQQYWEKLGLRNIHYLPPLAEVGVFNPANVKVDIGYIGSLSSPNNEVGLKWFVESVLPFLRAWNSNLKIAIGGGGASNNLKHMLESIPEVQLVDSPTFSLDFMQESRVLINPILHGSGVNIKTVDMMASGRPVVTTNVGVRGLPQIIRQNLYVTDNEREFAKMISTLLHNGEAEGLGLQRIDLSRKYFGVDALSRAIQSIVATRTTK